MQTDKAWVTEVALSAAVALGYPFCAVSVALAPDATVAFLDEWVHGIDLSAIKRRSVNHIPFSGWISVF